MIILLTLLLVIKVVVNVFAVKHDLRQMRG